MMTTEMPLVQSYPSLNRSGDHFCRGDLLGRRFRKLADSPHFGGNVDRNTALSYGHPASKKKGIPRAGELWDREGGIMIERRLNLAEIMLIAGIRVALGAGSVSCFPAG